MAFTTGLDAGCIPSQITTALGSGKYAATGAKVFRTGLDVGCFATMATMTLGTKYVATAAKLFKDGLDAGCIATMIPMFLGGKYSASGTKCFKACHVEYPCYGTVVEIARPYVDQDEQDLIPIF